MSTSQLLLVAGAVLAGSLLQGALGFGGASLIVPIIMATISAPVAVLATQITALLVNTQVSWQQQQHVERSLSGWLVAGALIGLPAGALLLVHGDKQVLQLLVGVVVLLAVGLSALRPGLSPHALPALPTAGIGALTGALSTSVGVNSPPLVLWLLHGGLSPSHLRATAAFSFALIGAVAFALTALTSGVLGDIGTIALAVLPGAIGGQYLGGLLFARLQQSQAFRAVCLLALAATGLLSIVLGLLG